MTEGEKMVWAATYAMHLERQKLPLEFCLPGNEEKRREFEADVTAQAVERATRAVRRLHELADAEDFGSPAEKVHILAMLGRA